MFFKQLTIFTRAELSFLKMQNLFLGLFFLSTLVSANLLDLQAKNIVHICSKYAFF